MNQTVRFRIFILVVANAINSCYYSLACIATPSVQSTETSNQPELSKAEPITRQAEPSLKEKKILREECIKLSREGLNALCKNDFPLAIKKYEQALRLNPRAFMVRNDLALSYNNYGLKTKDDTQALSYFHQSYFLNPTNERVRKNIDDVIKRLGKSKDSFADRKALGEQEEAKKDFIGAIVEYGAACEIKEDADLRMRMGGLLEKRDYTAAMNQYSKAKSIKDSPEINSRIAKLSSLIGAKSTPSAANR